MKKRIVTIMAGIWLLSFGCSMGPTGASYVKPVQMSQEVEFLAKGLGSMGVIGEIKRPVEGRVFTFVVKERQPSAKEWTTHYIGTTESVENWQPQAEKLAIFFDDGAKKFRVISEDAASTYTLDLPATLTETQYSWVGGFLDMNALPLNQFIPVAMCSVGNEPATIIPDIAFYEQWETNGKSYDYVIGIEVSKDSTQW